MLQKIFRFMTALGFALAIPLAAGGIFMFLPVVVPIALLVLLATLPAAMIRYFSEISLLFQLGKRLRLLGRKDLFRRIETRGKNLRGAEMKGLDLSEIHMEGVDFSGANLKHAKLESASIRRAKLHNTNLKGASLKGADLRGADIFEVNWKGALFDDQTRLPFSDDIALQKGMRCVV